MQLDFCPNCFAQTQMNICPKCNFNISALEYSPTVLKPGTIIAEKYKLGRVLGIGGFGITYLGYDIEKNVRYAIKEYMPKAISVREANGSLTPISPSDFEVYKKGLDMFLYETNILITLSDIKNIVKAENFVLENNTAYLIMEYLDGVSVKKFIDNQGNMDCDMAINILIDVSYALGQVHAKGLLHRDISPENIMILKDGAVKLIDFGAARCFVGERSRSLSLILKHGFAPPEQYSANGNQGEWTDIYALAATFYKIVTGMTLPDALSRVSQDTVLPLDAVNPQISHKVAKVIEKSLSVNYRDRYKNVDEFRNALKRAKVEMSDSVNNAGNDIQLENKEKKGFFSFFRKKGKNVQPSSETVLQEVPEHIGPYEISVINQPEPVNSQPFPVPYVRVINGMTTIGLWDLPPDRNISIGRDSSECGIVVPASAVSRVHCTISFDSASNKFILVDYSSNGTYLGNGERLKPQMQYVFDSGSVVMISSQDFIMEMGIKY